MLTLIHFMTVLYTRWQSFENYKKGEFYIAKKILKKLIKLCLHLGYIGQNPFLFDEIFFMENFKTSKFQF